MVYSRRSIRSGIFRGTYRRTPARSYVRRRAPIRRRAPARSVIRRRRY